MRAYLENSEEGAHEVDGLCPLIFNNMRSGWSNTVYAVDASEWGLGVVRSEVEPGCSKQWGQHLERWRFKDANAKDPRRYVLVEDERTLWLMKIVHPQTTLNGITRQWVLRQLIVIGKLLVALNGCEQIACLF